MSTATVLTDSELSSREVYPLTGAASRRGPERELHEHVFESLVSGRAYAGWSLFAEVPSPAGSIDIVAFKARTSWLALATAFSKVPRRMLDGLSCLRKGTVYRRVTLLRRSGLTMPEIEVLLDLGALTRSARSGLWARGDLPSDSIDCTAAFEVKTAAFPSGVVQAAMRKAVADQSWLVVPSESTAKRWSARTWTLARQCGIGIRSADLTVISRPEPGKRPSPLVLNRMLRTIQCSAARLKP